MSQSPARPFTYADGSIGYDGAQALGIVDTCRDVSPQHLLAGERARSTLCLPERRYSEACRPCRAAHVVRACRAGSRPHGSARLTLPSHGGASRHARRKEYAMAASVLFVEYPKCSTCRKAKKWLDEHGVTYVDRHIAEDNPTAEELARESGYTAGGTWTLVMSPASWLMMMGDPS